MKPPSFRYAVAETIQDVTRLLHDEGSGGRILAGGQSLIPLLRDRSVQPSLMVDIGRIENLCGLAHDGDELRLGACVTHSVVERWATGRVDVIAEAMSFVGHAAVRTFGTVGGALAYADPTAEWAAVALVLDGQCEIAGPDGSRSVPVEDVATGPFTTGLGPAEVITEVRLVLPPAGSGSAFCELAPAGEHAIVGVAAVLQLGTDGLVDDVRIGLCGVGEKAVRARGAEAALRGQQPAPAVLREVSELVLDDVREAFGDLAASATYRQRIAPVVTERALLAAASRTTFPSTTSA